MIIDIEIQSSRDGVLLNFAYNSEDEESKTQFLNNLKKLPDISHNTLTIGEESFQIPSLLTRTDKQIEFFAALDDALRDGQKHQISYVRQDVFTSIITNPVQSIEKTDRIARFVAEGFVFLEKDMEHHREIVIDVIKDFLLNSNRGSLGSGSNPRIMDFAGA